MKGKIFIFVVEDHPLTSEGITLFVNKQKDMRVVGHASSYGEALGKMRKSNADIALVDIGLADVGGLDLIKALRRKLPGIRSLVYTVYDEKLYAERTLRAGASGYVMKNQPPRQLLSAIRRVMKGRFAVSDDISTRLITQVTAAKPGDGAGTKLLSDRELEIFERIGQGRTLSQIANELLVSAKTVDSHETRIKKKLGLKTMAELRRLAISMHEGRL